MLLGDAECAEFVFLFMSAAGNQLRAFVQGASFGGNHDVVFFSEA